MKRDLQLIPHRYAVPLYSSFMILLYTVNSGGGQYRNGRNQPMAKIKICEKELHDPEDDTVSGKCEIKYCTVLIAESKMLPSRSCSSYTGTHPGLLL